MASDPTGARVKLLFVHQNFPGQFRGLVSHFAAMPGAEVAAIARATARPPPPGVRLLRYARMALQDWSSPQAYMAHNARRGRRAAACAERLRRAGFVPDVIVAHPTWGEALYLKDVFPGARMLLYCEFFFGANAVATSFDPEWQRRQSEAQRRALNAALLSSWAASDWGLSPMRWQWQQLPAEMRGRISVIHDGVDTDAITPAGAGEPELVTYAARNLEPARGFHTFMRAIPEIQRRCPRARIVIMGGDQVAYSNPLPGGQTYRARLLRELEGKIDPARVHFTGALSYERYIAMLRKSSAHVHLTYPYVLSWSMLEAMAAGCLVIGSGTPPVEEVIRDGENGLLADFFSPEAVAAQVERALLQRDEARALRAAARRTVVERYDLKRVCLPAQLELLERLREMG
jgi:glycosyltransferase involved in cell wall biosynthesis